MKPRFEVRSVDELDRNGIPSQPSEIIPLISTANEISSPLPMVPHFTTINETSKTVRESSDQLLKPTKTGSLKPDTIPNVHSSADVSTLNSTSNANTKEKNEIMDSNYSTVESNYYDTNSLSLADKFLVELRVKCRELRDKAMNLPIDQRIALKRFEHRQPRLRAQDIFDVHFVLDDSDSSEENLLNESFQKKIRSDIFDELDRQRKKNQHKQQRQLVFGRALLILFISLLIVMSITLVYVVIDLYGRAQYLDIILRDNEFISMIFNQTTNV